MKEPNKFDRKIKEVFSSHYRVPEYLGWEKMEIELPESPKPASSKLGEKLFLSGLFVALLLLVITCSVLRSDSFNLEKDNSSQALNSIESTAENKNDQSNSDADPEDLKQTDEIVQLVGANISNSKETIPTVASNTLNLDNEILNARKFNSFSNSSSNSANEKVIHFTPSTLSAENESDDSKSNNGSSENTNEKQLLKVVRSNQGKVFVIQRIPTILFDAIDFQQQMDVGFEIAQSFYAKKPIKNRARLENVNIGIGYNFFSLNSNVDLIDNEVGMNYSAGLIIRLSDKWKSNFQLSYKKIHSSFEHTIDLPSEINISRGVIILKEEKTYHNNYTNLIGAQLSVFRNISIQERFKLFIGGGLGYSFISSVKGKGINEDEITALRLPATQDRHTFNGSLLCGVSIPIKSNFGVGISYQYNYIVGNGVYLSNNTNIRGISDAWIQLTYSLN